jgi:sugar (pentulose or hexulose) kinase
MYLGIDCGTQGTKSLLIDEQGVSHGRGHSPHQVIQRPSGAREQDPQWWVEALRLSVKQAIAQAPEHQIEALAVSGQQHGLVVLDEQMQVIRPAKLWNDTETAPQNAELIARLGGQRAFFERFGIIPLTGYTVSKLLWLQQQEPDHFARIRHILLPHEYLNFWLTGNLCAEYGDASGTGYFDNRPGHRPPPSSTSASRFRAADHRHYKAGCSRRPWRLQILSRRQRRWRQYDGSHWNRQCQRRRRHNEPWYLCHRLLLSQRTRDQPKSEHRSFLFLL